MKGDLHLFIRQIKEDLNQSGHSCFSLQPWPSSEVLSDLSHLWHSVGCSENTKYSWWGLEQYFTWLFAATSPSPGSTKAFMSGCGAGSWRKADQVLLYPFHLLWCCREDRLCSQHAGFRQNREELGSGTGLRTITREKDHEFPLKL